MTLVNFSLSPAKITVLSDTQLLNAGGEPLGFASKIEPLPHISALWACRGPVRVSRRAEGFLNGEALLDEGIDTAARLLPAVVAESYRSLAGTYEDGVEMWLLGWSPSAGGFSGYHFASADDFRPSRVQPGLYFNPEHKFATERTELPMANHVAVAIAQHEMMRLTAVHNGDPWPSIGGDLLAFELTRAGLTVRKVGRFPDRDAALARMKAQR